MTSINPNPFKEPIHKEPIHIKEDKIETNPTTKKKDTIDSKTLQDKIDKTNTALPDEMFYSTAASSVISETGREVSKQIITSKEIMPEIRKEAKQSTGKLPNLKDIQKVLDLRSTSTSEKEENLLLDKTLASIHNSRIPSKEEIAYAIIERQANQLKELTEKCSQIDDVRVANQTFNMEMQRMGFKMAPIKVVGEDGKESTINCWTNPSRTVLAHTCPFWLVNSKISDPMVNTQKRDENFILKNNQKLCASIVTIGEARLFQPESRAGIILSVPPSSILDTYASDRLSPVGFRRTKEEVSKMSPQDKEIYEKNLKRVDEFVNLLKKYKALSTLTKHMSDALIQTILVNAQSVDPKLDNYLSPEDQQLLTALQVGLTDLQKSTIKNPKDAMFEKDPALLKFINTIEQVFEKHGKNHDEMLGEMLFGSEETRFSEQLKYLSSQVKEMLHDNKWKDVNIDPNASKWEKAIMEGEVYSKRLMPLGIMGPTTLSKVGEDDASKFVELNIKTKGTDLAGFVIDKKHFASKTNSPVLDMKEYVETRDNVINPFTQQLNTLNNKLKIAKEESKEKEVEEINLEIKNIKKKLAAVEVIRNREELLNLMTFCSTNFVPLIISGESPS